MRSGSARSANEAHSRRIDYVHSRFFCQPDDIPRRRRYDDPIANSEITFLTVGTPSTPEYKMGGGEFASCLEPGVRRRQIAGCGVS